MAQPIKILILDDEVKMGKILTRVLKREGHQVQSASEPQKALDLLKDGHFDLLLTDLKMPGMSGLEVMERARAMDPQLEIIMMTAYATVETAVEALKNGAADYLIKPFHNEELLMLVARLAETNSLRQENRLLKETLSSPSKPDHIIAASPAMETVLKRAQKVAATSTSILLRGESGTGKEVVATLIHSSGPRSAKPFIKVNCGALPETLLESELFGHTRGAFTGAVEASKGLFLAADGGTIFLDEIGEITPALQVKLLRVLQCGEFQRVGDPQTCKVDVRVIAATNRPLEELIETGDFRSDLYYRLNVIPILIPPLRERKEDVPALIDHFLKRLSPKKSKPMKISSAAYDLLVHYPWPGNIRELENAVEHAIVLSEGDTVEVQDLPVAIQNHARPAGGVAVGAHSGVANDGKLNLGQMTLREIEKKILWEALESTRFNHTKAAKKLGITRRTLGYRIDKYGLPRRAKDVAAKANGSSGESSETAAPSESESRG